MLPGKFLQALLLAPALHRPDHHTLISIVIAAVEAVIVRLDGQNGAVAPDRQGKSILFLPFLRLPPRCDNIDIALLQHGEHIVPRSVIFHILEIQVGVFRSHVQEFDSVSAQVPVFILHVVTVEMENPRSHRHAAGIRPGR